MCVGIWIFFECEMWDFGDDIIDGWFEGGWCCVIGDVVGNFV